MQRNLDNRLAHIPTLKADLSDHEPIHPLRLPKEKPRHYLAYGFLWLLVLLQSAVLAAGGWWGWQQLEINKQQLADSLHNLARINEQLGARIQRIDGKLISTASTVNSGSENIRQKLAELSAHLDALQSELKKQQEGQKTQNARQESLEQQFGQLASTSKAQTESLTELGKQLSAQIKQSSAQNEALSAQKTAQSEAQAALKALQQTQGTMQKKLAQVGEEASAVRGVREQLSGVSTLATHLSSLQKQVEQTQSAIKRLEREQLALKVEQENRASNQSSAEFDAFRAQTTRSLNNLQAQLQKLQQQ
ncbi:hypothetical protein AXE65_02975 [Ventosimonas gracilis]|uniref:ATPase n=1 Tax=Ventosimonas gracilis TaxID=1680762 RepID=A0A139SSL1_9GAMM|nr:hypothetical protein [Ventosimonas gracilis]KXU37568.1 hypothetical protein AXE65_02975 [Ventosimonas gracilis]